MGRDITLLVIYPFLFGLGMLWIWQFVKGKAPRQWHAATPRMPDSARGRPVTRSRQRFR